MTKSTIVTMGIDPQTLARWQAEAERQGLSVAEWIKSTCNRSLAPLDPGDGKPAAAVKPARMTSEHFEQLILQVRNSVYMVESATQKIQSHTQWLLKTRAESVTGPVPG